MTHSTDLLGSRDVVSSPRGPWSTPTERGLRGATAAILLSTVGAAVVALAYALARLGTTGATGILWLGQVLIYAPIAVYALTARRITAVSASAAALALAVVPYFVKLYYSPVRLTFTDELQHRLGTEHVLASTLVGDPNNALPIASAFPGLEALGAAVSAMTGIPVDATAMIVAGVLKTAAVLLILALVAELTDSARSALVGVLLYAANGTWGVFSSFYIYQTAALPLTLFVLYAAVTLRRPVAHPNALFLAAVACIGLTTVTHHTTAVFLAIGLVVVAVLTYWRREASHQRLRWLAVIAVAWTAAWFVLAARGLSNYLLPLLKPGGSVDVVFDVAPPGTIVPIPPAPLADQVFNRLGLVLIVLLVAYGVFLIVTRRAALRWPLSWMIFFILLSLALILSAGYAAVAAFGYQVASRSLVFTYLGAAVIAVPAVLRLGVGAERAGRPRRLATAGVVVLCIVGGLEFGWPPWWEKLPGNYQPAGFESGVDPHVLQASAFVRDHLPRAAGLAADGNGETALLSLADAQVQVAGAPIYYDKTVTDDDRLVIRNHHIRYVWADTRVATTVSAGSRYFIGTVGVQYTFPPPIEGLTKWASVPGVSVVYTDGTITIYDLGGTSLND